MLAALRSFFSFPLLAKELTERAARPRTYWMRIAAALLLYGGFWFNNDYILKRGALEPAMVLGAGESMFVATAAFLFVCVYAFVPAMLCGVVTQEKERDSLVLLLLTHMRPWQIVLQKYLGGLIPALTILFLAMPLVAVAYAYGGVTTEQVLAALAVLVLATLQVGALALWASCRFRTTVAAFLATYFVGAALFGLPALCVEIDKEMQLHLFNESYRWLAYAHFPPCVFIDSLENGTAFNIPSIGVGCANIAAITLFFLLAAIINLPRRAFATPKNRLRRIFATIDRLAHSVNRRLGSVTFGRNGASLPGNFPIVWREKRARALARPEYLVRLLVIIMIPIVLASMAAALVAPPWGYEFFGVSILGAVTGTLAVLTLASTAANGIVNERVNQTFELLLTTPMSATHILRQKARALWPFIMVLSIPLLMIFSLEGALELDAHSYRSNPYGAGDWYSIWLYLTCAFLTVLINLPLISWLGIWMGLWFKTRIRAIIVTLIVIIVWCGAPPFILDEAGVSFSSHDGGRYLYLLCPLFAPWLNEFHGLSDFERDAPWLPVLLNFAFYGGVLYLIRRHCLSKADWYLRG
jgi:ABC-type Na+ efflux pump permease subunit